MLTSILLWAGFVIFLIIGAFFAYSETAIITLDRIKLRHLAASGNRNAIAAEWLKHNPQAFFGIILLGTNLAIVTLSSIGHFLFEKKGLLLAAIFVEATVLIIAEITPKTLALRRPTLAALRVSPSIRLLSRIFGWLVKLLTFLPARLFKLDVGMALSSGDVITEMQIKTIADMGEEGGAIDQVEEQMIGNVIDTGNKAAQDIMIPMVDVVSLREGNKLRDAVRLNMETGLTRFPVYGENENDILGFLHTKDIIGIYLDGNIDDRVENHLRKIHFVPESKPAIDLLYELKATRLHIAIVIDEYGQAVGLVTLEDLLEELVGDIYDESDQITRKITKIAHDKYMLSGSLEIEKAQKLLGISIAGEYETLAGFVMGLLGRIPVKDDKVVFAGWQFKIGQMDKRRIRTVLVKRADQVEGGE